MVGWGEGGLEKVPTLMSDKGDFHFIHQILYNALQLTLGVNEKWILFRLESKAKRIIYIPAYLKVVRENFPALSLTFILS